MIGKVKKWLGIEGVKLVLDIPEEVKKNDQVIKGMIKLQSMNIQTVTGVKVVLIERYTRGRGKEKLVDEYELGVVNIEKIVEVPIDKVVEIPFTLPFSYINSNIEEFGRRNLLFSGLAKAARSIRKASSTFRLEAEAKVKGVALNPFDKREIKLT
jgi:hypothetical protein